MKHLNYLTLVLILFSCKVFAQNIPSPCPSPPPPGAESCNTACVYCDFDGYMGINNGTPSGGNTVCGQIQIHNDQWFGFIANSNTITIDVTTSNCQNGDGLQLAIFDNCSDPDAIVCNPGCGGCGNAVLSITYNNYEIGQSYFLMVDGWIADVCDFEIDVVDGSITPPAPEQPAIPSGPAQICPGGTGIYSIPPAYGAGFYHWTAPLGASINGGNNNALLDAAYGHEVTVTFGNVSGQVCVAAGNSCKPLTTHSCRTVNVVPIPSTQLPPVTVCNEWLPYVWDLPPYPELSTPGTYQLSSTLTSYLGCDSVVKQTVVIKSPIITSLGLLQLCAGECLPIGGQSYCQSGNYSVVLESYQGCDSVVIFRLEYLNPKAEITGLDRFYCEMDSIVLKAANTPGEKIWADGAGQTLANGDSLIVFQPGSYILRSSLSSGSLTCVQSDTIAIVDDSLSVLVQIIGDEYNCGMDSVELTGQVNVAAPTFAWSGPNGFSSSLQNPFVYETGQYVLSVATAEGCTGTDTLLVQRLGLSPDVIASGGTLTCLQPEVLLQGSSSLVDVTYHWSGPNGFQSDEQNVYTNYPGVYTLTVTHSGGCSNSGNVAVISDTTPPDLIAFDGAITCLDSLAQLQASSTVPGTTFKWTGPGGFESEEAEPIVQVTGEYTLTGTALNGCTSQITVNVWDDTQAPDIAVYSDTINCTNTFGTIEVSSSANITGYLWTGPDGFDSDVPVLMVDVSGVYQVTVTGANGCTQSGQTELLEDFSVPYSNANGDTLTCAEPVGFLHGVTAAPFSYYYWVAPGGGYIFEEDLTTTTPGQYSFVVVGTNGCASSVTVDLSSNMLYPGIEISGGPLYCTTPTTLACITDAVNPSFLWIGPNGFTSFEANPVITEEGYYSVTVTNQDNGCSGEEAIVILKLSTSVFWAMDSIHYPSSGQSNGSIFIHVFNDPGNLTYEWYADSQLVAVTQDLENAPAGFYTLNMTDSLGCITSWTFSLFPPFGTLQADQETWKVQPNPNSGHFSIHRSGTSLDGARIQVLDAFGRILLEQSVDANEVETDVDLPDAPSGWYILNIDTELGRITEKILVQRK